MKMTVPVRITNPNNGRSVDTIFRIDTGADLSAICTVIADELQARPTGIAIVRDAEGEGIEAPIYKLSMTIGNCYIGNINMVGLNLKETGYGGLIGMDILESGVLAGGKGDGWLFITGGTTSPYPYIIVGGLGFLFGAGITLLLTRK